MATLFDGISQQLDFTSCGEEGSSSDNSSDDYTSRFPNPRFVSPSSPCRSPRVQRHRHRSSTASSPLQCTSPIPYASWRKLRLCDSPSTPKVSQSSKPYQTDKPHLCMKCKCPPPRAYCPSHPSLAPALSLAVL